MDSLERLLRVPSGPSLSSITASAIGRKGRHLTGTFCLTGDTMEGIIQCLVFLKAFSNGTEQRVDLAMHDVEGGVSVMYKQRPGSVPSIPIGLSPHPLHSPFPDKRTFCQMMSTVDSRCLNKTVGNYVTMYYRT